MGVYSTKTQLTVILERVDYLKETLQGLVKGEADESNV